jgi:hypothetical protein
MQLTREKIVARIDELESALTTGQQRVLQIVGALNEMKLMLSFVDSSEQVATKIDRIEKGIAAQETAIGGIIAPKEGVNENAK